jgi:hypothetical protein
LPTAIVRPIQPIDSENAGDVSELRIDLDVLTSAERWDVATSGMTRLSARPEGGPVRHQFVEIEFSRPPSVWTPRTRCCGRPGAQRSRRTRVLLFDMSGRSKCWHSETPPDVVSARISQHVVGGGA